MGLAEADYDAILDAYGRDGRLGWRAGDVVVLDNLLSAHGREPYAGGWDVVPRSADQSRAAPAYEPAASRRRSLSKRVDRSSPPATPGPAGRHR